MENTYDISDHKPKDEDLRNSLEEGRSGYNTLKEMVKVVIVEVNR